MKTILQWFNTLENKELREKVISYTSEAALVSKENSLVYVLSCAFDWNKSPEGREYWARISSLLVELERLEDSRRLLEAEYLQTQDETLRDVIAEKAREAALKIQNLHDKIK